MATWHKDALTPGELDALGEAARRAWGADTRYPLASGNSLGSGQCYVTSSWLVERLGGSVGRRNGHYAWVSPDGRYVIDLTNEHGSGYYYGENGGFVPETRRVSAKTDGRCRLFSRRANRCFENLDRLLKYALDYAGDAYPAEEPQRTTDRQYLHDEPTFQLPSAQYKFVYANGQLEVSPDHDHSELADHAGIGGEHTGPIAVGWIVLTNGKATWEVKSNVNVGALERIFKDYCKNVGWDWGGITNVEGEPINDRFAPKKGSTIRYVYANGHLYLGRISHSELLLQSEDQGTSEEEQTPLAGWLASDGGRAVVWPVHVAAIPALCEWAEDQGLELFAATVDGQELGQPKCRNCGSTDLSGSTYHGQGLYQCRDCASYTRLPGEGLDIERDVKVPVYSLPELGPVHQGGSDNLMHRVEDLELENTGDNAGDFDKNKGDIRDPGEYREPSGLYRCPSCQRLFPSWKTYQKHRREQESEGDQFDDGKFPEINMDVVSPFEPHFTPQQPEIIPIAGYREASRVDGFLGGSESDDFYVCYHYGSPVGYARISGHKLRDLVAVDERYKTPLLAKVVKYTEQSPSQLLAAPVPFIYDIDQDQVTVGQAGQRTSDIPGQFSPGGIIEGQYEPGGKIVVRTMTNMPYSVRHMVELWYWQHPELEVKNVHLQDAAGGDTKLAAEDVGGTIARLLAASPAAFSAAQALREGGGRVFAVGGAVRDALTGKAPKDIDLMVTGLPGNVVQAALSSLPGRVDYTGKDFGVFRYRDKGDEVEVALPRRERSTGPLHRDFEVEGDHTMTPEEDLYRRDFTANAMAVDLSNGRLIDPYGGADDLAARRLRTINPQSLNEDPLRVVRALVAHARHGLVPDDQTRKQMTDNAGSLIYEPAERIQQELDKLFAADRPGDAIRLAHETGVLKHILPEVERAFGYDQNNPHHELELGAHLVNVLDRVAQKSTDPDLRLAGLLHDIGKPDSAWEDPETGKNHYYMKKLPDGTTIGQQHEDVGADLAHNRMAALRYPNDRMKRVEDLIRNHMWKAFTSERGARKFLNRVGDHADDLMTLRWADQGGKTEYPTDPTLSLDTQRNLLEQVRNQGQPTQQSQLAINGNDLIQAGIPQGPQVGQILRQLTEAVIEDPRMNTPERLLTLALQNGNL